MSEKTILFFKKRIRVKNTIYCCVIKYNEAKIRSLSVYLDC